MRALLVTFLFVCSTFWLPAQTLYEVISSANLNVRSAPDLKADVIGVLKPGELVQVHSISGDWAELIFNSDKGYSAIRFLQIVERVEDSQPVDSNVIVMVVYEVVSTSRLNVRNKPSAQSQVLGSLVPGSKIEGGEEIGEWLKFNYGGTEAYTSLKFLKKEEIIERVENVVVMDESAVVDEPVVVKEVVEIPVQEKSFMPEFMKYDSLFEKPCLTSGMFDLFLSGRLGMGISSFTWKGGKVNGKAGVSLDAVAQAYWKSIADLYMEASLGYSFKGAAKLPMHYLNIGLSPFGYYYDYNDSRFVGNCGFYFGVPLSSLEYVGLSKFDIGASVSASVEYNLLSFGLEFTHGIINIATPDVKLNNWGLMAKLTCKIISLNK